MSKKANPTFIGVFIFIGLLLGVCGLLLFTSSKLFTSTAKFIIYFDSSLNGLNEGAPVKYRGVTIGSVTRVMIHYNQATNDLAMPVIIELRADLIRRRLESTRIFKNITALEEEVQKGLRARLETESLVTGVLFVELERESSPPPAEYHQLKPLYIEIPSRPTEIQALMKNLAKMDLSGLEQRLSSLVTKLDTVLDRLKLDELTGSLTNFLNSANHVVADPELTNAFTSLNETLHEFRLLGAKVNNRIDPLADGLTNALEQLNHTLVQTRGGMQNFRDLLAVDSSLRNELNVTLNRLAEASESVSTLADYLHKYPNSLLTGRKPPQEKKP